MAASVAILFASCAAFWAVASLSGCGRTDFPAASDAGAASDAALAPITIEECGEITGSGSYSLATDIGAGDPSAPCLSIHVTKDVSLDCGGHAVNGRPAVSVQDATGFKIENCRLTGPEPRSHGDHIIVLDIRDSSDGEITGNVIGSRESGVNVVRSNGLLIRQNEIKAVYQQYWSSRVRIAGNTFLSRHRNHSAAGVVVTSNGSRNEIVDNLVDGQWDGTHPDEREHGSDDGIVLFDESQAVVSGNEIKNNWDCGIETGGLISDSLFSDNTIVNAGFCGIGGWYWSGLRKNTFVRNTAAGLENLFAFFRIHGLRPADDKVHFSDNVFLSNRLDAESGPEGATASSYMPIFENMGYGGGVSGPGEREPGPGDFSLEGNVFKDNDFCREREAPSFGNGFVPGRIGDGGGNLCSTPTSPDYPLRCN